MENLNEGRNAIEGDYILIVTIYGAEDLDPPSRYPDVTRRLYRAFFWMQPNKQYRTMEAFGMLNPEWKQTFKIKLNKNMDNRFLYVEIVRSGSTSDPGTSRGTVLVGRAQIPLPKLSSDQEEGKRGGRFGLVRLDGNGDCKAEGYVFVSMKLVARWIDQSFHNPFIEHHHQQQHIIRID